MQSVTSNSVAEMFLNFGFSLTEKECSSYFDGKRYHKSYIFREININANSPRVITNDFEIALNKVVGITAFAVNQTRWYSSDLGVFMAQPNNQLCIYPRNGTNDICTLVVDVQYVK